VNVLGAGVIVVFEYYSDVPKAFDAFASYKDIQGIRVGQCPSSGPLSYPSIMQNYVMKTYKGQVSKYPYTTCLTAKTFISEMKKLGLWDAFCEIEDEIDVTHPFVNHPNYVETVVANNAQVLKSCMAFCDAHSFFCVKDSVRFSNYVRIYTFGMICRLIYLILMGVAMGPVTHGACLNFHIKGGRLKADAPMPHNPQFRFSIYRTLAK